MISKSPYLASDIIFVPHPSLRGVRILPSVIARRDGFCPDEAISVPKVYWHPKREIATPAPQARNDKDVRARNDVSQWVVVPQPSLRGGTVFVPTRQSLVPGNRTNGDEGTPKERLPRALRVLAMTKGCEGPQ